LHASVLKSEMLAFSKSATLAKMGVSFSKMHVLVFLPFYCDTERLPIGTHHATW
jgi:hypothetical protein